MKTQQKAPIKTFRLKKNDTVQIIAGRDKGKLGKILEINKEKGRVYVEGINYLTYCERPTQQNPKGSISKKEGSVSVSNMLLYCPKCDKGVRIGNKKTAEGLKNRVCTICGDII
ncbi:MAG: 50S ribosomal protein L24 [Candidatus Auribacterota bacterium]|jgi:large subunit ribosomal protein L24|nr:50S ribosomal protein L24 [Candidatus Auribacterota bacterium]